MASIDLRKLFESEGKTEKKFADALMKALKKGALSEFDYLKFKHSLKTIQDLGIDESSAFKSAFATAQTIGLTKNKLLGSARHYRKLLDKEKSQFAEALQNQIDQRVANKKNETLKLQQKIKAHEAQMEKLQNQIHLFKNKLDNMDEEIDKAKNKIETTRTQFLQTLLYFVEIIDKDIDLVETYL